MLELLTQYSDSSQFFNLFNYITFRTGGAIVTAMILAFAIGAPFIAWLRKKQGKGQPIREDGPQGHLLTKKGTPTMGGLIILISLGISSLLWADLKNPYVWSVLIVTVGFGAIDQRVDPLAPAVFTDIDVASIEQRVRSIGKGAIVFAPPASAARTSPSPRSGEGHVGHPADPRHRRWSHPPHTAVRARARQSA